MKLARAFVQLSSRSWQGVPDFSVSLLDDGRAFFSLALEAVADLTEQVVLLTPSWDEGAPVLSRTYETILRRPLQQVARHDSSPLARIVAGCEGLTDGAYVLRLNGLNAYVRPSELCALASQAAEADADVGLYEDDVPPQLTADVFRVGALRDALRRLPADSPLQVHPRQAVVNMPGAKSFRYHGVTPTNAELLSARRTNEVLYRAPHLEYDDAKAIAAGDQLGFHYDLAIEDMGAAARDVLDIACGVGFGSNRLFKRGHRVVGADIDPDVLRTAESRFGTPPGLSWTHVDGQKTAFEAYSFDAITTFETLEHVDSPERFLGELCRILKPSGVLYLSVPQNRWGHIPLNPQHLREYSATELRALLVRYFEHVELQGIKQGRIILPGDPIGANSFATCRGPKAGRAWPE